MDSKKREKENAPFSGAGRLQVIANDRQALANCHGNDGNGGDFQVFMHDENSGLLKGKNVRLLILA